MKHNIISQVDAQVINKILVDGYGYNGGWIQLFGLKTPERISTYLRDKHSITVSAHGIVEWLRS
jgi:hypothetical protein